MVKIKVYNKEAEVVEELDLSSKVFGVKANEALVHQAVVTQMSNERQVLAHTKVRSEIRGGGKKPWRQKGTGRARVGSSRNPLWRGGGVVFGPSNERNFKKDINKKMKQKALLMALSDKVTNNSFVVVNEWQMGEFKTKAINEVLGKLETKALGKDKKAKRNILLLTANNDQKTRYSGRNLAGVTILNNENINIVDVLKHKAVIITKDLVLNLEKKYSK